MRSVSVYRKDLSFFLISRAETPEGILVVTEPRYEIPTGSSDEQLGEAVLRCLNHPVQNIPFPADKKRLAKELLGFVKSRNWRQYRAKKRSSSSSYSYGTSRERILYTAQ